MATYGSLDSEQPLLGGVGGGDGRGVGGPLEVSTSTTTTTKRSKQKIPSTSVSLAPSSRQQQQRPVLKTIISRRAVKKGNDYNADREDGNNRQQQQQHFQTQHQQLQQQWIGPRKKKHSFVYTMLNPRSDSLQATIFKWFMSLVIVLDLTAFILSTEPDLSQEQQDFFSRWEAVDSWIFLIEYILRVITVTESNKYGEMGPIWGRLKWMMTTPALIDLISTLPYFIEKFTELNLPTLTYLRSLRLLRLNKTAAFSEAVNSVCRVFYYNKEIMYVSAMIGVALVLFTAVLMYYLRPRGQEEHPEFKSIPRTLYLSTLMLTGQGGPEGPELPWYTSSVVLLTGVFSIGMFAIPASMLTWGFEAEAQRYAMLARMRKEKEAQYAAAAAGDEAAQAVINQEDADEIEHDNWSYSSNDYSTDEEYQKIIAGVDGDEDEDEEERMRRQFELADVDGSGNISLGEFLKMSREMQQRQREQAGGTSGGGKNDSNTDWTTIAPRFAARIGELERRQQEQGQKIDRILMLLESTRK